MSKALCNWLLAAVIALLLAGSHLLDGPDELEAAQATADSLIDAIAQARADARAERTRSPFPLNDLEPQ